MAPYSLTCYTLKTKLITKLNVLTLPPKYDAVTIYILTRTKSSAICYTVTTNGLTECKTSLQIETLHGLSYIKLCKTQP